MERKGAWITAGATVLAAIIGAWALLHKPSPQILNFSGEVRNASGTPIVSAKILLAQDQQTPQSTYSDENGVFHIVLPESAQTLKILVTAPGYEPINRDVNLHRTGPEEFVLQRSQALDPQSGKLTTNGPNSPIVQGNHNRVVASGGR